MESASDKENCNRAVRFVEAENSGGKRKCLEFDKTDCNSEIQVPREATEMILSFKSRNHILVSNNSLKPNSAVRQLFPDNDTKYFQTDSEDFVINDESLRTFEHRSYRRSLIRYEPKTKKAIKKQDNSLVERIKLLTCDLDRNNEDVDISGRISPIGEAFHKSQENKHVHHDVKNYSPSSSSTTSSNSSSISSTCRRLTDLFVKREKIVETNIGNESLESDIDVLQNQGLNRCHIKINPILENRKQLISTLAPLTACVNVKNSNEYCYNLNDSITDHTVSSRTITEYITESRNSEISLKNEEFKPATPDVLDGTPQSIDKIAPKDVDDTDKSQIKHYTEDKSTEEDEDNDDYGFNKRPSVQGVKQRFSTTTEILQQIDGHLEVSDSVSKLSWPYYSENSFMDNNQRNAKVQQTNDKPYQNACNKSILEGINNTNSETKSVVMGFELDYNEYCLPQLKNKYNRPLSPPPQDFSRNYRTMVYVPYNHIEGYWPSTSQSQHHQSNEVGKINNLNSQNRKHDEYFYQQRMHQLEVLKHSNILPTLASKPDYVYLSANPVHLPMSSNNEPSVAGQTSAKSTQTLSVPLLPNSYFHNIKCKSTSPIWKHIGNSNTKNNQSNFLSLKNKFPALKKSEHLGQEENNCINRQLNENNDCINLNSYLSAKETTQLKFMERGVPEGADSGPSVVSTNIRINKSNNIAISPSSPHFMSFYAMNV